MIRTTKRKAQSRKQLRKNKLWSKHFNAYHGIVMSRGITYADFWAKHIVHVFKVQPVLRKPAHFASAPCDDEPSW